jgi:hypothetical protein
VRVAVANTRQSLTGSALDHLVIPRPGGFLDAALGFGVLAGDALGVDAQKDVDTVARPLCDLGSGYARIDNYLHFFNAAPLRSAARRYPHGAARAALWLEAPRARARQPDASTRLTRGGSSPLPDSPASAGTRRGRSASPAAMQCRVVKDQRGGSRKIVLSGVSLAGRTRPLVGRRQSVTIFPATRGPVENSVCHDHHQS